MNPTNPTDSTTVQPTMGDDAVQPVAGVTDTPPTAVPPVAEPSAPEPMAPTAGVAEEPAADEAVQGEVVQTVTPPQA